MTPDWLTIASSCSFFSLRLFPSKSRRIEFEKKTLRTWEGTWRYIYPLNAQCPNCACNMLRISQCPGKDIPRHQINLVAVLRVAVSVRCRKLPDSPKFSATRIIARARVPGRVRNKVRGDVCNRFPIASLNTSYMVLTFSRNALWHSSPSTARRKEKKKWEKREWDAHAREALV